MNEIHFRSSIFFRFKLFVLPHQIFVNFFDLRKKKMYIGLILDMIKPSWLLKY